tara:strand:+ start:195 stop:491 length:297 start_codon:yes stop_codon:yes gene_type:complete
MHTKLETTQEAVELALYLAITADCNELSAKALSQAKDFAADLTEAEMIYAKANVSRQVELERFTSGTISKLETDPVFAAEMADKIFTNNRYITEGELT